MSIYIELLKLVQGNERSAEIEMMDECEECLQRQHEQSAALGIEVDCDELCPQDDFEREYIQGKALDTMETVPFLVDVNDILSLYESPFKQRVAIVFRSNPDIIIFQNKYSEVKEKLENAGVKIV